MKIKILVLILAMISVVSLIGSVGCSNNDKETEEFTQEIVLSTEIPSAAEPSIQLHYYRKDAQDYLTWGFWIWADGKDGDLYTLNYQDAFGGVAVYPVSRFIDNFSGSGKIGIIPRLLSDWVKDCDADRFFELSEFTVDSDNYYHIYLTQGDVELYKTKDLNVEAKISSASFVKERNISVSVSKKVNYAKVYEDGKLIHEQTMPNNMALSINLPDTFEPNLGAKYTVEVTFSEGGTAISDVSMTGLYSTDAFNELYYYDGELGAIYSKTETIFRVWSPVSTSITLNIYAKGNGGSKESTHEMVKGDKGVFEVKLSGDLGGKYYTYTVINPTYPSGKEIVDPYAKSAGLSGLRGQIVDFSETNPEGWDDVSVINCDRKELTVYETHVADVTSSSTWGGSKDLAKTFLGMAEEGTTYTEGGVTVTTGFDHIKELGVNAVQLVPIFDQANDESNPTFNWGYNPLNYNVLEGSYSTDATDGYTRIREFKKLVAAYNKAGINIVMDVVYNHVNGLEGSNFDVLMPGYYFRYTTAGKASNGSGCGNETASENAMFRKFMIDSACFWAEEYKLGGFRFDLMGLHDLTTMEELVSAVKEINPDIVVYGEPWTGGTTTLSSSSQATQANGNSYVGYGQFNDQMRDALIKGGLCASTEKGWITNDKTSPSSSDVNKILDGIKGTTASAAKIADPDKTVNYVTCHDNYTLYDRIKAAGTTDEDTISKMAVLANSVVFTSQGTTFMLAGEEFLRTKQGNSNSYNASYKVNELDYSLKVKNANVFTAYQKLIAFKQDTSSLHLGKDQLDGFNVESLNSNKVIKITFTSNGKDYIIYHANGACGSFEVSGVSGYSVYLNTLNVNDNAVYSTDSVTLQSFQTLILYK